MILLDVKRTTRLMNGFLASVGMCAGLSPMIAQAQIDPNIQSRIELLQQPAPQPSVPTVTTVYEAVPVESTISEVVSVPRTATELRSLIAQKRGVPLSSLAAETLALSPQTLSTMARDLGISTTKSTIRRRTVTRFEQRAVQKTAPPQPSLTLSLPFGVTYDSNVFRRPSDPKQDWPFSFGGSLSYTLPVGAAGDDIAVVVGTSSSRYPRYETSDSDTLSGSVTFRHVLGKKTLVEGISIATIDRIDFGVRGTSSFVPFYKSHIISFYTPQVTFSRLNVPLSNQLCGTSEKPQFCTFADISGAAGYSFSDIEITQNSFISSTATVGWRIANHPVTFRLGGGIKGKYFDHDPINRKDLELSVSPSILWTPTQMMDIAISSTAIKQYSTKPTAEYAGITIQPSIRVNIKLF